MTVLEVIGWLIGIAIVLFLLFGFIALVGPIILYGLIIGVVVFGVLWFISWASTAQLWVGVISILLSLTIY